MLLCSELHTSREILIAKLFARKSSCSKNNVRNCWAYSLYEYQIKSIRWKLQPVFFLLFCSNDCNNITYTELREISWSIIFADIMYAQTIRARIEDGDPGDRTLSTNLPIFMRPQLCKFWHIAFLPYKSRLESFSTKPLKLLLISYATQTKRKCAICKLILCTCV